MEEFPLNKKREKPQDNVLIENPENDKKNYEIFLTVLTKLDTLSPL